MVAAGEEKPQKRVRFRVASGNSGRVLKEIFKDEGPSDSLDSDCTSSSDADRASTPSTSGDANGHLYGFLGSELDDSESEPDDLLMYVGASKDRVFSTKRVNILSKNGTVRGVKHKVSAGQVLFENLPNDKGVSILGDEMVSHTVCLWCISFLFPLLIVRYMINCVWYHGETCLFFVTCSLKSFTIIFENVSS